MLWLFKCKYCRVPIFFQSGKLSSKGGLSLSSAPTVGKLLLIDMTMMGQIVGHSDTFQSTTDVALCQQMFKHSNLHSIGGINTSNFSPGNLVAFNNVLLRNNNTFEPFTNHNPHVYSTVMDSGVSWTVVNSHSIFTPGSLSKFAKPIPLAGIAGSHQVEYSGRIALETVDKKGNIIPVEHTVMVNVNLPYIILSPQAFLKESAKSVDEHFSIYADRTEWIVDSNHCVNLPYDSRFLPRLMLFKQGQAEPSLKAFFSLLHSSNRNLSLSGPIFSSNGTTSWGTHHFILLTH